MHDVVFLAKMPPDRCNYSDQIFDILFEIKSQNYRGEIIQLDLDYHSCLVTFTYPYNPVNGCGRDGMVYVWVSKSCLQVVSKLG
ncbi:MAG: hypothetical protein RIG63_30365 [Coleofasciculus chthonoplastes F3-SA18-01]|uniref:hypothetical protein n=1 Tax=Coleofasciculus chthonoplastes TaxID=64178 RepID=UPI003304B6CD